MKTLGIIVEYNPLHNGHAYHFLKSKADLKADAVIAVMSGNFLQRGEPAIVDKWARTEMALHLGIDVVIELPVAYATQPAEWFAFGAVSALDATGVVDCLCFGSESGDVQWLNTLADRLAHEPEPFRFLLKKILKSGVPYPTAYTEAIKQYFGFPDRGPETADGASPSRYDPSLPNNTLGLHYLIALKRLNSQIEPFSIPRIKSDYRQKELTDGKIASATAIRRLLEEKGDLSAAAPYVPEFTYRILDREWAEGRGPVRWESFAAPLFHLLLSKTPEELEQIHEIGEGLEHRLKRALTRLESTGAPTVEHVLAALKTKRYTRTKLQRALLNILLNHTKKDLSREHLQKGVPYLRVLGFSERGQMLLKKMKKTARVPVWTGIPQKQPPFLALDIRAASVYSLAYSRPSASALFRDFYQPPLKGPEIPLSADPAALLPGV